MVIRTRIQDFTDGWLIRKENGPSISIVNISLRKGKRAFIIIQRERILRKT